MAVPFAASELSHAITTAGILLAGGLIAGPGPDVDLRLGLRHRGVTHSVEAAAVVGLLVLATGELVHMAGAFLLALVVSLAWVSHIAADLTNRTAVAVLWPRWWGPFRWGVREGSLPSVAEESAVWVLVLLLIVVEFRHRSA